MSIEGKKIALAIRAVESGGNYKAKGASGESGAYQFMPSTWKGWAKTYLGDSNAPMTKENQNKVAVMKIDDYLNQGYTPRQVALAWNGGTPVEKKGVNKYGVKYDSGAYANKVLAQYQQVKVEAPIQNMSNFWQKVDEKRLQGYSDTDILNNLSKNSQDLSQKISQSRILYGRGQVNNDRDLLNFMSKKFSGKMPTVASVPTEEQKNIIRVQGRDIDRRTGRPIGATEPTQGKTMSLSAGDVINKTGEFYKNSLIGGAKGIFSTISGTSKAGQGLLQKTVGAFMGQKETPAVEIPKEFTKPTNATQSGGKTAEQLAEYFIPGKAVSKISTVTETASPLVKILSRTVAGAGEMAIPTALQTGGNVKQTVEAGVMGGVVAGGANAIKILKTGMTDAQKIDRLASTITQGKVEDIQKAKKALTSIDTKGIKTYKDLTSTLDKKIESLSRGLEDILDKNKTVKKLPELKLGIKVGSSKVSHNYVDDALNQMEDYYTKTGNVKMQSMVSQVKQKASTQGLTVSDINNIAKQHGLDLNGFNANGELASGLKKQFAENTRVGLKETAKDIFKNPVYDATDKEISNLIHIRDLASDMVEKVNTLKQKVNDRKLVEGGARSLWNAIDSILGGGPGGFLRAALVPRGGGLKTMNALDLENALQKNLKEIQGLLKPNELKTFREIFKDILFNPMTTAKRIVKSSGKLTVPATIKRNEITKGLSDDWSGK